MEDSIIKIGIVGYGNIGKGVFSAIQNNPDTELSAIITRDVERTKKDFFGDILEYHKKINIQSNLLLKYVAVMEKKHFLKL